MNQSKTIGYIGLGLMGKGIATNLIKAGYSVLGFVRDSSKKGEIEALSVELVATLADLATRSDIIISTVTSGADLHAVIDATIETLRPGSIWIDHSTISPQEAKDAYTRLAAKDISFLDAPVTGGPSGAAQGTLTIMVGGDKECFEQVDPLLHAYAKKTVYFGQSGAGQQVKIINQVAAGLATLAAVESYVLANRLGLDKAAVHDVISSGAGGSWVMSNFGAKLFAGDLQPGFHARNLLKDLRIATSIHESQNLPGLSLLKEQYEALIAEGDGELGTQGLAKRYV